MKETLMKEHLVRHGSEDKIQVHTTKRNNRTEVPVTSFVEPRVLHHVATPFSTNQFLLMFFSACRVQGTGGARVWK